MDVHVEIAAETLFKVGPVSVTNSMLTMFVVMGLILLVGWVIARRLTMVPGRGQGVAEAIVEFLLGLVEGSAGKVAGRRIFPLIGGIFIFILLANYSGLLPGVGTVGRYEVQHETASNGEGNVNGDAGNLVKPVDSATGTATDETSEQTGAKEHKVLVPFLRAPNADLNMTLAMALVTFTTVQILGVRKHGFGGRIKHMADPPFLFPIELVSELSRIISLSARLFGNVFAGEVLLGVMYAMANAIKIAVIPFLFPVVFLFLELLFGAIQALVFALLTLIYITLATEGGHEDHAEAADHGHAPVKGAVAPAAGHAD